MAQQQTVFVSGSGNDTIHGDANTTVEFLNVSSAYDIIQVGTTLHVVDHSGLTGTDILTNVGTLFFLDKIVHVAYPQDAPAQPGQAITTLPGFDATYYLAQNPDVAAAVAAGQTTALQHYLTNGWKEGRNPDAFFNTDYYLQQNPDVAAAGMNPLVHYDSFGYLEGRNPSANFDTGAYLAANPSLIGSGVNPLDHYLEADFPTGLASYPVPPAPVLDVIGQADSIG